MRAVALRSFDRREGGSLPSRQDGSASGGGRRQGTHDQGHRRPTGVVHPGFRTAADRVNCVYSSTFRLFPLAVGPRRFWLALAFIYFSSISPGCGAAAFLVGTRCRRAVHPTAKLEHFRILTPISLACADSLGRYLTQRIQHGRGGGHQRLAPSEDVGVAQHQVQHQREDGQLATLAIRLHRLGR